MLFLWPKGKFLFLHQNNIYCVYAQVITQLSHESVGVDLNQSKIGFIEYDLTAKGFAWNSNVFFEIDAKTTILAVI